MAFSLSLCQSGTYEKLLTAVYSVMSDILALDQVDDVFGDVGGVVTDALEVLGDEDEFERRKDDAGNRPIM